MPSLLQGFNEITTVTPSLNIKLTVTDSALRFNKETAKALNYPAYVKVLINDRSKRIAITPCEKGDANAVRFSKEAEKQVLSITVKTPKVLAAVQPYFPLEEAPEGEVSYQSVKGNFYQRENVVIFNVADAVAGVMKHRGRRKGTTVAAKAEDAE